MSHASGITLAGGKWSWSWQAGVQMAGGSGQFDSNVAAGMKNYGGNCGRDSSFCGCTLLGPSASGIPTIHGCSAWRCCVVSQLGKGGSCTEEDVTGRLLALVCAWGPWHGQEALLRWWRRLPVCHTYCLGG
ncbi:uncharacterized protein [Lolium perenne]|uniref:uncharacterized protein n=1 Tax=Lolium perenne TaxID=4522 RepID=UPI003A9A154B